MPINGLFIFGTRPEAIELLPDIQHMKSRTEAFDVRACVSTHHREVLVLDDERPEAVSAGTAQLVGTGTRGIQPTGAWPGATILIETGRASALVASALAECLLLAAVTLA